MFVKNAVALSDDVAGLAPGAALTIIST